MFEKIEVIYNINGYSDPNIKNVEVSRVNGYKTVITKEGEEKMVYQLKNITEADVGKIIECIDQKDVDIEDILSFLKKFIKKGKGEKEEMTNLTDDEKRFSKEVKIVEKYQESHPGVSYRDSVLACLDRTEPETKQEFTEEQKEDSKREKENLEKIDRYIEENPEVEYGEAVKIVLGRGELTENEKKVEEYIQKRKSQGIEISYREAVLKVLDKSEEPEKEE